MEGRWDDLQLLRIHNTKAQHFSTLFLYPLTSCPEFRVCYLYRIIRSTVSSCSFLLRSRQTEKLSSSFVWSFFFEETTFLPLSLLSVALSYQIHKLVDRRKEECWISDLCVRESVDIKNSQYSSLFDHSRVVCILTSRSNRLQFGMARGFLQQENRSRMRLTLTRVVFLLGSSNLLFLRSSNYSLDSRPISRKNSSSYEPSGSWIDRFYFSTLNS